ncbi:hypothetical protein HOLleu_38339 [Holothuria leucospilota]|uniref:Uncharacterized protein n=1 Tax=Holothuria leucospilota TaxID=206669 RepID=A0A9Q0YEE4_HOLLE|nr:hypothetical protein HOLleu_38339 [Holothuria leucospilota]
MSDNQTLQRSLSLVFLSYNYFLFALVSSQETNHIMNHTGHTQNRRTIECIKICFKTDSNTTYNVTMSKVALLFPGEEIWPRKKHPTVPVMLKFLMIILGIVSLKPPSRMKENVFGSSRCKRLMLFLSSMCCFSILIVGALFTIYWYTVCFLGKSDHLFRFLSFLVTYWSVILSAQIICFVALARNNRPWRYHIYQETSWVNLFREATFARKISSLGLSNQCCLPSIRAAVFFYGIAAYLSFLEIYHFSIQYKHCTNIPLQLYISVGSYVCSMCFHATFCYCLYLQR